MKTILELFSGTENMSNAFRASGWDAISVENDPRFSPTFVADIMTADLSWVIPDVIWASPPCTGFSVASIGSNWMGGKNAYIPKSNTAKMGIKLVRRTIKIIEELKPKIWFIENPRGVLRKMPFMQKYRRVTVSYCQYGDMRMKPTDIWTNSDWQPRKMCKNGDSCHEPAPRGSKTGTQGLKSAMLRSELPKELCKEIVKYCNNLP